MLGHRHINNKKVRYATRYSSATRRVTGRQNHHTVYRRQTASQPNLPPTSVSSSERAWLDDDC
ncbi:hypothetical protein J6590_080711 [Homalodisca vitripennis]|nr:hypothetical protein J6590_080711 [Homalodisca vitripennis]